jgi:hypothetical protein
MTVGRVISDLFFVVHQCNQVIHLLFIGTTCFGLKRPSSGVIVHFTEADALLCHFSLCQGARHVLLLVVCLLSVSVYYNICVVFVAAMLLVYNIVITELLRQLPAGENVNMKTQDIVENTLD